MTNVQTNFRAVDMPGAVPAAPAPAVRKIAPVVEIAPEPVVEVVETEAGE
jgi:hypothetical protein